MKTDNDLLALEEMGIIEIIGENCRLTTLGLDAARQWFEEGKNPAIVDGKQYYIPSHMVKGGGV